jgi:hypothetical protein
MLSLLLSLCVLNGLLWIAPAAASVVQECQRMNISLPPTFSPMQLVVECSVSTTGGTLNVSGLDFVAIGSPAYSPPPSVTVSPSSPLDIICNR